MRPPKDTTAALGLKPTTCRRWTLTYGTACAVRMPGRGREPPVWLTAWMRAQDSGSILHEFGGLGDASVVDEDVEVSESLEYRA